MINIAIESACLEAFPALAGSLGSDSFFVFDAITNVDRCRYPLVMSINEGKLSLSVMDNNRSIYVDVDFCAGSNRYRKENKSVKNELLAKAVGLKSNWVDGLQILDATAGFGRDSFLLAGFGCQVVMLERSALMAALLFDGLQRAKDDTELSEIVGRMKLVHTDALAYLQNPGFSSVQEESAFQPDVIYLDPMFPSSNKTAQVKKDMRILRSALGEDEDGEDLIQSALLSGVKRLVVKRPRKGEVLGGGKPAFQVLGKSARFDVYFP